MIWLRDREPLCLWFVVCFSRDEEMKRESEYKIPEISTSHKRVGTVGQYY